MTLSTFLILAAVLCVVASLGMGIASMVRNAPVGHHSSSEWMTMRVTFQGLALLLIIAAILT